MFEEGATVKSIIKVLANALDFVMKRAQIIELLPNKTVSSIASALYRLKKLGTVVNAGIDPSLDYGYWRLIRLYRKIRHTKRIVETRQAKKASQMWHNPDKKYFCDCEATSEGFVPVIDLEEKGAKPPARPDDDDTERYGSILNPKLKIAMLNALSLNGISLIHDTTDVDPTCKPKFFPTPKYCVEGTEWLDELSGSFEGNQKIHVVEVVFQNDIGETYPFTDFFEVSENEF